MVEFLEIGEDRNNFIFFNSQEKHFSSPIKRGQACKIISSICRQVGSRAKFGLHSLRKTWGHHVRMQQQHRANKNSAQILHMDKTSCFQI